jgi:hypothetical protein
MQTIYFSAKGQCWDMALDLRNPDKEPEGHQIVLPWKPASAPQLK